MSRIPTTDFGKYRADIMRKYEVTMSEITSMTDLSRQRIVHMTTNETQQPAGDARLFEILCAGVAKIRDDASYLT